MVRARAAFRVLLSAWFLPRIFEHKTKLGRRLGSPSLPDSGCGPDPRLTSHGGALHRYAKLESTDPDAGQVIWPEAWQNEMQPSTEQSPWRYMIVERDHFPRFDQSKLRTRYDGEAVIWLDNVPYECEAGSLVCWVQAAMEAALPFLGKAKAKEEDLLEKFEVANAELMDCVKQPSKDEEEEHYKAVRV